MQKLPPRDPKRKRGEWTNRRSKPPKARGLVGLSKKSSDAKKADGKSKSRFLDKWRAACATARRESNLRGKVLPTKGSAFHKRATKIAATL